MGTRDDVQGSGGRARSSPASTETAGEDRVTVEVAEDLAVSVAAPVEPDDADGDPDVDGADDHADTLDVTTDASADDEEQGSDAPLGLTTVRLPGRGRRRGRPGTIF
jgi:hypothetical protein